MRLPCSEPDQRKSGKASEPTPARLTQPGDGLGTFIEARHGFRGRRPLCHYEPRRFRPVSPDLTKGE